MLASLRNPSWKAVLAGLTLTTVFLALGVWQLTVVSAGLAGFLSGRGRSGAVRGIQSAGLAWIWVLLVLSFFTPVSELLVILGAILGPGWGLVVFLYLLIPVVLGAFGGMAGGYLAELLSSEEPKSNLVEDSGDAAR
jgi:hypothetical protein